MGEQAVWISGSSTFHSGGSSKQKALRFDECGIQFKEAIGSGMGGERGKDRWSRRSWEADHEGLVGQGWLWCLLLVKWKPLEILNRGARWSDFCLWKIPLASLENLRGQGWNGKTCQTAPSRWIHPGDRWLWFESRWWQWKWWEVVGLRIHLGSRVNKICCWIGPEGQEKENGQGWLQHLLTEHLEAWSCYLWRGGQMMRGAGSRLLFWTWQVQNV